ncbi:MAG: NAD(P)H-nitrite reductase large subunit, partial [Candidatus Omnitrophota bacterium]
MKRIIVIGHSPAAVKAVEIIRQKDTEAEITILAHSGAFPYRRDFFAEVLSKEKSVEDIQYKENKFYKDNNIKVVTDCNITRINLSRKRVYTESKEQYQFDIVILADLPEGTKLTDLKGGNKEGIYSLRRIKYLDKI